MVALTEALFSLLKGRVKGYFALNWEPAFQLLETFFSREKRSAYQLSKKDEATLKLMLPKVIYKLKQFFAPESSAQIYKYIRGFIGPVQGRENYYLFYLHCLLRTDYKLQPEHYEFWMKELLSLWDCNRQNRVFSSVALSLLSSLARSHYEIDWDPYIEKLFVIISSCIPYQMKDGEFLVNLNNISGLVSPEENLSRNYVSYSAKLVVALLRPAHGGKCISQLAKIP